MIFTEEILRQVILWAMYQTAKSLGLADEDSFLITDDALDLIAASTGHAAALREFADAYRAWYECHLRIVNAGASGALSPQQDAELQRLIQRRDAAKARLAAITRS